MIKSLKWAMIATFLSATVVAQQPPPVSRSRPLADGQSLIEGRALNVDKGPLANATIRLRNLQTKKIDQVTVSNVKGEFSFIVPADVPFVVEIADQLGRTAAVGDVISTHAGDIAAVLIALPAKLPAVGKVFSDTAGSVMAAATGAGVAILQTGILPVLSPER